MNRTEGTEQRTADVHVIGGGLGGLAAAALVARAGRSVVLHERRGRLGGRATTDQVAGYRFNQGPHALYQGGAAESLLRELGIGASGSTPAARGGRIVLDGTSHLAPGGFGSLVRTGALGLGDKVEFARAFARLPKLRAAEWADRTVSEFVDAHATRPTTSAMFHALVRLTSYVNAPDDLSAEIAVMQLQAAFGRGVRYLDHGWEHLVACVADAVVAAGGSIERSDGPVDLPDAPVVIVAVGGPAAAGALVGHGYGSTVAAEASTLDLALRRDPSRRFVIGVDQPIYLSDHGFPAGMSPSGGASVSLAQYLAPGDTPDRASLRAFANHAGITADDIVEERYLHRMTTVTSIATAGRGGLSGRADVAVPDRDGVFVVGDWVGREGHLLDAVMASARTAAAAAVSHLDRRLVAR